MKEHLPECWANLSSGPDAWCMCEELRFYEERVHETANHAGKAYGLTVNGYTRGLDAARKAVEGLDLHGCLDRGSIRCNCVVNDVIAAIDALRDAK